MSIKTDTTCAHHYIESNYDINLKRIFGERKICAKIIKIRANLKVIYRMKYYDRFLSHAYLGMRNWDAILCKSRVCVLVHIPPVL